MDAVALGILARQVDEIRGQRVADAAAARMEHDPDAVGFIEADLDEMVAAAQRADLVHPLRELAERLQQLRVHLSQCLEPRFEGPRRHDQGPVIGVLGPAHRDIARNLVEDALQGAFVELPRLQRQPAGHHAAADIDPDRRRDDRPARGDHRADRRTDAEMDIRHRRHVVMDDGQRGDVGQLVARSVIDVVGPDADRDGARGKGLAYRHDARTVSRGRPVVNRPQRRPKPVQSGRS